MTTSLDATKDKPKLDREPSINPEPETDLRNHDDENDDLDLRLFSKYLPRRVTKKKIVPERQKGLTPAEEEALNEAQKAKEAENMRTERVHLFWFVWQVRTLTLITTVNCHGGLQRDFFETRYLR